MPDSFVLIVSSEGRGQQRSTRIDVFKKKLYGCTYVQFKFERTAFTITKLLFDYQDNGIRNIGFRLQFRFLCSSCLVFGSVTSLKALLPVGGLVGWAGYNTPCSYRSTYCFFYSHGKTIQSETLTGVLRIHGVLHIIIVFGARTNWSVAILSIIHYLWICA